MSIRPLGLIDEIAHEFRTLEFNPIEQVFAKLKGLLRKTAARTLESLWQAVGALLEEFSPDECDNYIRHCGYGCSG